MKPGTTMAEVFDGHVALFYNDENITTCWPNLMSFTHEISWFRFSIIPEVHKGQVLRYFGQLEDITVPVMLVKAACEYVLALVGPPATHAIHPFLHVTRLTLHGNTHFRIRYRNDETDWMIATNTRNAPELVC
ncbi:hypothetical protein C8Q76DRAFT_790841 [Earliella scabrosa]|nr:hypothetical protein C8Q76DRAFT_790841 [Earliella scabrosa]